MDGNRQSQWVRWLVGGVLGVVVLALAVVYGRYGAATVFLPAASSLGKLEVTVRRALPDSESPIPPNTDKVRYYLVVDNSSKESLSGVRLHLPIPLARPQFKAIFSMSNGCQMEGQEIVCEAASQEMAPGEANDFYAVFDVAAPWPCNANFTVQAWAEGSDSRQQAIRALSNLLQEEINCS